MCADRRGTDETMQELLGAEYDRLVSISQELFAAEERAMQRSGYPDLARHALAHQRFLGLLTLHCRLLGRSTSVESCLEFLGHTAPTWWRRHIEQQDAPAATYMTRYDRDHPDQDPLFE